MSAECPSDIRPYWDGMRGHWRFANGSWVHLFGADDKRKANRGRGPKAVRAVFDEAGFTDVLGYVLSSVFRPSLLLTNGDIFLGSTPSDLPDHEFTRIAEIAEANGSYFRRTVYENPMLSPERLQQFVEDDARDNGMTVAEYTASSEFRREYMAERVSDSSLVVMGDDWREMREAAMVEVPRPQFYDGYEALDMGGVDPHAGLFGYWHFERGWLVIEDELLLREGQNTAQLADAFKDKERALWGIDTWAGTMRGAAELEADSLPKWLLEAVATNTKPPLQPYLRVCDNDVQIAKDLMQLHRLAFVPTEKTDKFWHVNEFRILLRQGRVKIHPRCRNLDRHLRTTVWANERHHDYKRKAGEHGDLLDCAIYMARNIRKTRNPVPHGWGADPENQLVRPKPPHRLRALAGNKYK
jgi:hypothetical protein